MNSKIPAKKINYHPGKTNLNFGMVLEKLPPEAIYKAFETVREVIHANKLMEIKDQEFQNQLQLFNQKNIDRKDRLKMLMDLISSPRVPEQCISQLITSICNIAEGKNE